MVLSQASFRLENEGSQGLAVETAAAHVAKVGGKLLLGRVPKKLPGYRLENFRGRPPQGRQPQPHHRRAAFDVLRARAIDAVAFGLPVEIVARLFFGWKYRIEMRHHRDGLRRATTPRQHQMIGEVRIRGRDDLRGEPERRKSLRSESCQAVYALAVGRVAVDAYHLAQHFQSGR